MFTKFLDTNKKNFNSYPSNFQNLSGLAISPEKSCFSPVDFLMLRSLQQNLCLVFRMDIFLFLTWGCLCAQKSYQINDCEPLLQWVKNKICTWTS